MGTQACERVQSELSAFVRAELSTKSIRAIENHLRECDECRREEADLRSLRLAFRRSLAEARGDSASVTSETSPFHNQLMQRVARIRAAEIRSSRHHSARPASGSRARLRLGAWIAEETECLVAFMRMRVAQSSFVRGHLFAAAALVAGIAALPFVLESTGSSVPEDLERYAGRRDASPAPLVEVDTASTPKAEPLHIELPAATFAMDPPLLVEGDEAEIAPSLESSLSTPIVAIDLDSENVLELSRLRMSGRWSASAREHWRLRRGGDLKTDLAVERGLMWLAREQLRSGPDAGSWPTDLGGDGIPVIADPNAKVGLAALSLIAFVSDGQTESEGRYRIAVRRTVDFLVRSLDTEIAESLYSTFNLATTCMALAEHQILAGPKIRSEVADALNRGLRHLVDAGLHRSGGIHSESLCAGHNMAWTSMALATAKRAAVDISGLEAAVRDANEYLDYLAGLELRVVDTTTLMAGAALDSALDVGLGVHRNVRIETIHKMPEFIESARNSEDPVEPALLFFAAAALCRIGGDDWESFNEFAKERLLDEQRADGYWTPGDYVWECCPGGDVYTTALSVMTMQVYYRFLSIDEAVESHK